MIDDYVIPTLSDRPRNSTQFFKDHVDSHKWRCENLVSPKSDMCYDLTILIPSCSKHKESTDLLLEELNRQKLKYLVDRSEHKDLGTKRQDLYWSCRTKYALQWDADDWIHGNFASIVSPYLRIDVDCINFVEHVIMGQQTTVTRRSLHFPWNGVLLGPEYCFSPNTKSIVNTELAREVEFEKGLRGEDLAFGRDLRPFLKSEINIDVALYYYEYCDEGSCTKTNSDEYRTKKANGENGYV